MGEGGICEPHRVYTMFLMERLRCDDFLMLGLFLTGIW